jgi:hypothetical protein
VLRRTGKRLALQCVSFPPSLVIDCPPMMFRNYSSKIAQRADSFKDCSKVAKNAGSARISWVSGFPLRADHSPMIGIVWSTRGRNAAIDLGS